MSPPNERHFAATRDCPMQFVITRVTESFPQDQTGTFSLVAQAITRSRGSSIRLLRG